MVKFDENFENFANLFWKIIKSFFCCNTMIATANHIYSPIFSSRTYFGEFMKWVFTFWDPRFSLVNNAFCTIKAQLWATCPHRPQLFYVKILQFLLAYWSATPWEKLNITSWEIMGRYFAKFREFFFKKIFQPKKVEKFFWSKIILKHSKCQKNTFSPLFDHFCCSAWTILSMFTYTLKCY